VIDLSYPGLLRSALTFSPNQPHTVDSSTERKDKYINGSDQAINSMANPLGWAGAFGLVRKRAEDGMDDLQMQQISQIALCDAWLRSRRL
jgi:hypothetical protein